MAYSESMSFEAVITHLGIGIKAVRALREANLLPVWIHGGCSNKHRYLFVKSDVDRWVSSVVGEPVVVHAPAPGHLTIADINRRTQIPFLRLIEAIVRGEVAIRGRLADAQILGGAIVARSEVLAAMEVDVRKISSAAGS